MQFNKLYLKVEGLLGLLGKSNSEVRKYIRKSDQKVVAVKKIIFNPKDK